MKTTVKIAKAAAPVVIPAINLVPGASGPLAIAKIIVPKLASKLKDSKLKTLIPKVASKLKDYKLKYYNLKDDKLKPLIPKFASKPNPKFASKPKPKVASKPKPKVASKPKPKVASKPKDSKPKSSVSEAGSDASSDSESSVSDASSVFDASSDPASSDPASSDPASSVSDDESFAKQYKTLIRKENENHLSDVKLLASLAKKTIKIEDERSRLQAILTKLKGTLPDSQTNEFNIVFKEVISIFDSRVSKC